MKRKLLLSTLALACLAAPNLQAQEKDTPPSGEQVRRPDGAPPPPPERDRDAPPPPRDGEGRRGEPGRGPRGGGPDGYHRGDDHRRGEPEMKMMPYLGIMTRAPGPEVVAQAGLNEGFGLLVQEVMPESPAAKAGLKQHDLLHLFEDQKIVNVDQLTALVRAAGKGKEVKLTVKRGGQDVVVTLMIEEKLMPVERHFGGPPGGFPDMRSFIPRMQEWGEEQRERAERFGDAMREYQNRLQEWMRGPKDRPQPEMPRFEGERRGGLDGDRPPPPRDGERGDRTENRKQVTVDDRAVTRRDDAGEYSYRSTREGKVFTVKPKDGEEQEFEVNTPEQREKVPAAFRQKLEELEKMSRTLPERPGPEGGPRAEPPPSRKDSI